MTFFFLRALGLAMAFFLLAGHQSTAPGPDCQDRYAAYFPKPADPIKTLRVNFVFLQNPAGTGNFQADKPEHRAFLDEVVSIMNRYWAAPSTGSCYQGDCPPLPDTRIRVAVDYLFIKDPTWNNDGNNCIDGCANLAICDEFLQGIDERIRASSKHEAINVFFTNSASSYARMLRGDCQAPMSRTSCSMYPRANPDLDTKIHMVDLYLDYLHKSTDCPRTMFPNNKTEEYVNWGKLETAKFVNHELGHALGLGHVRCPDNLMKGPGQFQTALNPHQIGRMHYCLSTMNVQKYLRSYARE